MLEWENAQPDFPMVISQNKPETIAATENAQQHSPIQTSDFQVSKSTLRWRLMLDWEKCPTEPTDGHLPKHATIATKNAQQHSLVQQMLHNLFPNNPTFPRCRRMIDGEHVPTNPPMLISRNKLL